MSVLVGLCLMFPVVFAQLSTAVNTTLGDTEIEESVSFVRKRGAASTEDGENVDYAQALQDVMACGMASIPASLRTRLLGAEISPECSVALLRTVRGFQNLEPWALRLLDATGKYPTGVLQGSRADSGAFDECIETVVKDSYGNDLSHGQYCNLLFYIKNSTALEETVESMLNVMHPKMRYYKGYFSYTELPMVRLGICFLDDCSQEDIQTLVDSVKPSIIDIKVSNCVTAEPEPWSTTQMAIVTVLSLLVFVIAAATSVDLVILANRKCGAEQSLVVGIVKAFSAASNTHALLKVADRSDADHYALQFLHGLRLFSLGHIVLGHCYLTLTDNWSCLLNFLVNSHDWPSMIVAGAFNSVDTFFFLSGFFLCLTVRKQRRNGPVVFMIGMLRRLVRTCVPLFFILMCFYIIRLFVTGPDSKAFFVKFQQEVSEHWWHLLLQIKNFYKMDTLILLGHTWFLSADFQLFIVALPILLLLKSRTAVAVGVFVLLSLLSYAVVAWTLASHPDIPPFLIAPGTTPEGTLKTVNEYYERPFYHAMCYFGGCITFLLMNDFRERKITKAMELAGWCVAASSMLCCVFMKLAWYKSQHPTSMTGTLLAAFSDRFLWFVSLAWITLSCSTGRGGLFGRFLSSNVFVPLSKLSFGVYLIHVPFIELMLYSSRERIYWSHFNQVSLFFSVLVWSFLLSYLAYLACEAPTSALDKLAFGRLRGSGSGSKKGEHNAVDIVPDKKADDISLSHF